MSEESEGTYSRSYDRAWRRAWEALRSFRRLPFPHRAAGVGAVLAGLGTGLPWFDDSYSFTSLGIETLAGIVVLLLALAVCALLAPLYRERRPTDSGAVAVLGLVMGALLAAELIRSRSIGPELFDVVWGFWVSAAGAVLVFLSGISLYGGPGPSL